jgi:NADPH:quinone reductase-like Zn-dependent oxidoreductase
MQGVVILQNNKNFKEIFKSTVKKLGASILFECVAGDFGGLVFNLMPPKSIMYLYGSLFLKPLGGISPVEMIYNNKDIKHLQLHSYILNLDKKSYNKFMEEAIKLYKDCFGIKIAGVYSFDDIHEAIRKYSSNMSEGKIILKPKF